MLLSTTKCLGSCDNIVSACFCILVEPDWTMKKHRQAFGRVYRTGAIVKAPTLWLMADRSSGMEMAILERQSRRKVIGDSVFGMPDTKAQAIPIRIFSRR